MSPYRQLLTVALWEYRRFYKIKSELLGIGVMAVMSVVGYWGGSAAVSVITQKVPLSVVAQPGSPLVEQLSEGFLVDTVDLETKAAVMDSIAREKEGALLWEEGDGFVLFAWKEPSRMERLKQLLAVQHQEQWLETKGLTREEMESYESPAPLQTQYLYTHAQSKSRLISLVFAGIMVMAVFISFAYQFTAITGEKQLRITEQIVSAVRPQVWMDGKIIGITLTAFSSMIVYFILMALGGFVLFMFSGSSLLVFYEHLDFVSVTLYFLFTLTGVLLWNAMLAAVASVITDPNNSGKSGLMLLPVLFVMGSLVVLLDPDHAVSVFLSWFPFTSATAMPMRWVSTPVAAWEVLGSFLLLAVAFYGVRRLAAAIFRISILINGKEPSWTELMRMLRH